MKNSGSSAITRKAALLPSRRIEGSTFRRQLGFFFLLLLTAGRASAAHFRFDRDTFAFANETVFEYRDGHPRWRGPSPARARPKRYASRCFVMTRAALQFHKFARFDSRETPLDDRALAERIRAVTRQPAWQEALAANRRIVFPGYSSLREMSGKRGRVLQDNIGIGWPTYFRLGNFRMVHEHSRSYQEQTHANLDAALAHGELFVVYLSTFPSLTINHAVLVYARRSGSARDGRTKRIDRYDVYDPNHAKGPRELTWSPSKSAFAYQKDWDFVGGFVQVYQVYGKPLQ
jgi:hypothetical protein